MIQPLWRAVWKFLKKLGIQLPYDPAIPLLGIHPEKNIIQRHMYSSFHSSTLCNIRTWKQPRCPLTDEWIKKLWYIYTVEHNSATKRNELKSTIVRWIKLEPVKQNEVIHKNKYFILIHIYGTYKKWY